MLTNLAPPIVSGSSTQTAALSRELSRRRCRIILITSRLSPDSPSKEIVEGVVYYRLPAFRLPSMSIALNFPWLNTTLLPGNLRRIQRILEEEQVELLHAHNHMFDLELSAARLRDVLKLPLIVTVHTIINHPNRIFNKVLYAADRHLLNKRVIRRADAIICPALNVTRYVSERFDRAGLDVNTLWNFGAASP